ncbi:MAG: hypothetical protein Hyperionvirus2_150 [Hyperionvirus sp.]|uniref:Uncharacterized protein n=1 Tax=Hyperionvirus sp. TaxID=2487770 RepID=A0A3G5A6X2_9VIRU|nr:MAG: hypothetical protein Hyperionvirus2_150 [Hyperionvirus sp.]
MNDDVKSEKNPVNWEKCCATVCCAMIPVIYFLSAGLSIGLTFHHSNEPFNNDCGYGTPAKNNSCVCYDYYMAANNTKCTIAQKSWLTASLLQTFFGFVGAGFAYIQNYTLFGIELGIFILIILLLIPLCNKSNDDFQDASYCALICLGTMAAILMWIITFSLMWQNHYPDGNGYPLFKR